MQIPSRRDSQSRVEIRIIPGPHASEEHKANVQTYITRMDSSKDLRSRFMDVLKQANIKMGIRADMSSTAGTIFSEDILKIEIYGPREDYLTVIDVPGIFRNQTEGITTKEDMIMVHNLVREYIKDKRTIILAVLPSNVDINTQEIIDLAKEYDKLGERTLGVLTKPDLVTEYNTKLSVSSLVSGKRKPLSLGYYIVRNRGADDKDSVKHDALEKIFQQEPWCSLPPNRVGISALKKQLETLLAQITRREFPSLREEIKEKLSECQNELTILGPARPTEKEQRSYLSAIARQFEELTRRALGSQYSHQGLFEKFETRLITQVVNLTDLFSDSFQQYGQIRRFEDIGASILSLEAEVSESGEDIPPSPLFDLQTYLQTHLGKSDKIKREKYTELSGMLTHRVEIEEPKGGIMGWIKNLHHESRGMNLGTFNPDLLSVAFVEQSRQWEQMVGVYMGEVVLLIHHFMKSAIRDICADDDISSEIWSAIIDVVVQRYEEGLNQAKLLVHLERLLTPYTLNRSFNEEVQIARGKRARESLRPKAWKSASKYGEDKMLINLDDVADVTTAKPNDQDQEEEIYDKLRSYYHLAVKRVMDNILLQAVGYKLLSGPSSPLNVFSQAWVIDLNSEQLEHIAGEQETAKERRQMLTKKSKDLKMALDILKK